MHSVTRRTMILGGVGVGAAVAAESLVGAIPVAASSTTPHTVATPARSAPATASVALRSHYAHSVGQRFTAITAGAAHTLTLATVADLRPVAKPDDENRFALIFTAEHGVPAQGLYTLRGPRAPDAQLFIAPVGPAGDRTVEAVVNRVA